jgi:hypothetical protein
MPVDFHRLPIEEQRRIIDDTLEQAERDGILMSVSSPTLKRPVPGVIVANERSPRISSRRYSRPRLSDRAAEGYRTLHAANKKPGLAAPAGNKNAQNTDLSR